MIENWAGSVESAGVSWIDMKTTRPKQGAYIFGFFPFSLNQVRVIKKYEPDNPEWRLMRGWSPVTMPFDPAGESKPKKDDSQVGMPF